MRSLVAVGVLSIGFAGVAGAEPRDRDDGTARMQMHDVQRSMADREARATRPESGMTVTGRELGRDTIHRGDIGREFKSRADMTAHMTQSVKMRQSEGSAPSDGGTEAIGTAPAGERRLTSGVEAQARMDDELLLRHTRDYANHQNAERTAREAQIETKSVTGRKLGEDRVQAGQQYVDPMNQGRAKALHAMFPSAGQATSDPARMNDRTRAGLAAEGFEHAGKHASSADIEDKGR